MKNVLITGCSTGIGAATAELFAKKGWNVFAGSRHPEELHFNQKGITPMRIDVNDNESIALCFRHLEEQKVQLDVIINNAGYGLLLPFEDTPKEKIEELFRANVFGLMEVCRHAATIMREQGSGTIINISSVIGQVGAPFYTVYAASKFAVEGFSESLYHEMRPFGVHVKIVEPGATKTEYHRVAYDIGNMKVSEPYRKIYEHKRATHDQHAADYTPASVVADVIYAAATDGTWKLRYPVGAATKATIRWRHFLPEQYFLKKLYERFIGGWGR